MILDRDGVLNAEAPSGWVTRPEDWAWERCALEGLARIGSRGRRVSVATNQSWIGRGLAPPLALEAVHERMRAEARAAGGRIDAVLVCPHAPDAGCDCRKPAPGLVIRAIRLAGIPAARTLFVGDSETDMEAGRRAGVATALVRTGKGTATAAAPSLAGVPRFDDLVHLAAFLDGEAAPATAPEPLSPGGP